jgi:protein transport protein SEC23
MEMKALAEKTGGYVVIHEQFQSEIFQESYKKMFERDSNGDLKMGAGATLTLLTSKELKICGAIGPCTSLRKGGPSVAEQEIGQGGTN